MSLKYKMIILFLIVILVPLNLLGMITYYQYSDTLEKQTLNYSTQIANQINENINQYIDELYRLALQPLYDQNVLNILQKHNQEEAYYYPTHDEIESMRSFISSLTYGRKGIKSIQLITNDRSIFSNLSSSSIRNRFFNLSHEPWYEDVVNADGKSVLIAAHSPSYYFKQLEPVFSVAKVIRDLNTFEHIGIIKIDVDINYVRDLLGETHFSEDAIYLLLDTEQNLIYQQIEKRKKLPQSMEEIISTVSNNEVVKRDINEILQKINNGHRNSEIISFKGKKYLPILRNDRNSYVHSVVLIPEEEILNASKSLRIFTIFLIIICTFITIILAVFVTQKITLPIYHLRNKMIQVEKGDFNQKVAIKSKDEIGELSEGFNNMMEKINQLIKQVYQTEIREKEAEIRALQSQINPHFIYNTLESINMMAIIKGNYEISDMVSSLGKLIRYTVDQKESLIKLREELDFVESYLNIQKLRYEDRLEVFIDIPDDLKDTLIPKLILQPILENAIVHGLEMGEISGKITLKAWQHRGNLLIRVSDNGKGLTLEEQENLRRKINDINVHDTVHKNHSGIALKNIQERIQLLFGDDYGLRVESSVDVGTDVIIVLPYRLNK